MEKQSCANITICASCGEEAFSICKNKCLKCGFTVDFKKNLAEQIVNTKKKEMGV